MRFSIANIIKLVFPVIFNLIFFLFVAIDGTLAQWSAWLFINVAYAAFIYTLKDQVKERLSVLNFTIYAIGLGYFFIALIVGVLFMAVFKTAGVVSCIVQLILLGVFVVVALGSKLANISTEHSIEQQRKQGLFIQSLLQGVNGCIAILPSKVTSGMDSSCESALRQLAQALEISPLQSSIAVVQIEQELQANLLKLQQAVAAGKVEQVSSLAQQMILQINQRNSLLEGTGV